MPTTNIKLATTDWITVPCDWCGSFESESLFEGPDRLERLPGNFWMVSCKSCGLIRQNPRLKWEKLQDFYPEAYVAYQYEPFRGKSANVLQNIRNYGNVKRRRAIEKFKKGGQLLEIGCGTGAFLRVMQESNRWEIIGVEPNKYAADFARDTLNIPIYQGLLSETSFEDTSFDVIVMFCVLEHLSNPVADLRQVSRLLRPGGLFVFTIPNFESLARRLFTQFWSGWDLPRHLYIFPENVLHQVLNNSEFQIVDKKCLANSFHSLGHNLEFWSQNWENKYPELKKILMRFYYSWFSRLLLLFPLNILDRLKLSTNITYFVQKL